MDRIEIAGWVLECDAGATRRALAALPSGAPERCGCLHCRNFAEARDAAYGPVLLALLTRLGVPADREAEVYDVGPAERWGHRRAGGWFHFIGRVVRDPLLDVEPAGRPFAGLAPGLQVFFAAGGALVPDTLAGVPVVQLEFEADVPWVLPEPAPAE